MDEQQEVTGGGSSDEESTDHLKESDKSKRKKVNNETKSRAADSDSLKGPPAEEEEEMKERTCKQQVQMEENQQNLQMVLKELEHVMSGECFKYAKCLVKNCRNKETTDPQDLYEFFSLLNKDLQSLNQKSDKGNSSSSLSRWWTLKSTVKVYSAVTGRTSGAHDVILEQVKKSKCLTVETTDLQKCNIIIVFCPIMSRVGSDVEAAMRKITGDKSVILVLMHHTRDVDYSTDVKRWSEVYQNVKLDVHVLFHETLRGLLKCPRNDQAVQQIQEELKKHSKWL